MGWLPSPITHHSSPITPSDYLGRRLRVAAFHYHHAVTMRVAADEDVQDVRTGENPHHVVRSAGELRRQDARFDLPARGSAHDRGVLEHPLVVCEAHPCVLVYV